jgi:hypothetical protein
MFSKHGVYVVSKKSKCGSASGIFQDFHDVMYMSINMEKQLMPSKTMGRLLYKKAFTNIGLVMCGQITYGLITINLVSDNVYHGLVFKTLL